MKFLRSFVITFLISFTCGLAAQAQSNLFSTSDLSNVNIDDYSDVELMAALQKMEESGLTENDLYKLAQQRGMPATEISKLKMRIQTLPRGSKPSNNRDVFNNDTIPHLFDSTEFKIPKQQYKTDPEIFGSELFSSSSMVFEPNLRIPAPSNYILGPDDEVVISVFGYSEKKYNLKVDLQGEIYIPNVGPILVNGMTLEDAGEKIKNKLASTIYRNIRSGQTKVQVTLGRIKSIRVTVIGQAKKPGNYTVSSLTTLYNILYLCGGPTSMGSYRNIEIIRGNQVKRTADLYDFLVDGNQKDNVLLQEGDVIRIPYYQMRVTLSGNVKRKGKFEMKENETFSTLMKFSGGFTDNAYRGAVSVVRLTDSTKTMIDLHSGDYDQFKVQGSDQYTVSSLQDEFGNRIVISGSVLRPGPYELTPGMTVKDLITKAGGPTVDAFTKQASIFRYYRNKMPTILSINIDSVLEKNQVVYLQKNDSLAIHSIFDFNDSLYISIEGNVRNPGQVLWRQNMTLRDLILEVGGLTEMGDSSNIEISRRIKDANIDMKNHNESEILIVDISANGGPNHDVRLFPYDQVVVKNIPGYTTQRSVLVLGEVKAPGKYGLQKSGDRISDIFKRTGGFKASADSSSITIRRNVRSSLTLNEREKMFQRILNIDADSLSEQTRLKDELYKSYDLISIDLTKALTNPKSSENLILEDGDILTIERSSNLVKVSGEVYYPTFVPYQPGKNLKYYVEKAGNFMPYAQKNGALVIGSDGQIKTVKHFLFFKSYPEVGPRSEIFVPQKQKNNRNKITTAEWAIIVSALGIAANVILQTIK